MCHLYHHNLWGEISDSISKIKVEKKIYVNLTKDRPHEQISEEIKDKFPDAKILVSPNQGKDIGGNLRLIGQWLEDGSPGEVMILCHSKNKNDNWRRELFSALFNNYVPFLFTNSSVGMAGHKNWVYHRGDDVNSRFYKNYCMKFELNDTGMDFVAGTMFAVRSSIFRDFFSKYNPVELANELENGDVHEPSKTHAWERLYGEIVKHSGHVIKSIEHCEDVDPNILESYNEEYYLATNPDVKRVVMANDFSSGLIHYIRYGKSEQRVPYEGFKFKQFNEKHYLDNNLDVMVAIKKGQFKSGYDHYIKHGHKEKRKYLYE
jgi:hypothetical protein